MHRLNCILLSGTILESCSLARFKLLYLYFFLKKKKVGKGYLSTSVTFLNSKINTFFLTLSIDYQNIFHKRFQSNVFRHVPNNLPFARWESFLKFLALWNSSFIACYSLKRQTFPGSNKMSFLCRKKQVE